MVFSIGEKLIVTFRNDNVIEWHRLSAVRVKTAQVHKI